MSRHSPSSQAPSDSQPWLSGLLNALPKPGNIPDFSVRGKSSSAWIKRIISAITYAQDGTEPATAEKIARTHKIFKDYILLNHTIYDSAANQDGGGAEHVKLDLIESKGSILARIFFQSKIDLPISMLQEIVSDKISVALIMQNYFDKEEGLKKLEESEALIMQNCLNEKERSEKLSEAKKRLYNFLKQYCIKETKVTALDEVEALSIHYLDAIAADFLRNYMHFQGIANDIDIDKDLLRDHALSMKPDRSVAAIEDISFPLEEGDPSVSVFIKPLSPEELRDAEIEANGHPLEAAKQRILDHKAQFRNKLKWLEEYRVKDSNPEVLEKNPLHKKHQDIIDILTLPKIFRRLLLATESAGPDFANAYAAEVLRKILEEEERCKEFESLFFDKNMFFIKGTLKVEHAAKVFIDSGMSEEHIRLFTAETKKIFPEQLKIFVDALARERSPEQFTTFATAESLGIKDGQRRTKIAWAEEGPSPPLARVSPAGSIKLSGNSLFPETAL